MMTKLVYVLSDKQKVLSKINIVRNQKGLLDADWAEMYGFGTKVLNQAVKRNPDRFPIDFMIQIADNECPNLRV